MISSSLDCIQGNITVYDGSRGNPFPIICAPMLGSTTYTASSADGLLIEFYMLLSPLTITATFKSVETPGRFQMVGLKWQETSGKPQMVGSKWHAPNGRPQMAGSKW